jgi:hypothetical protein
MRSYRKIIEKSRRKKVGAPVRAPVWEGGTLVLRQLIFDTLRFYSRAAPGK